jgi:hypothetical protein
LSHFKTTVVVIVSPFPLFIIEVPLFQEFINFFARSISTIIDSVAWLITKHAAFVGAFSGNVSNPAASITSQIE